jgi:hypothetical protein
MLNVISIYVLFKKICKVKRMRFDEQRFWLLSFLVMASLVVLTLDVDYDSYFRFVDAQHYGYSLKYANNSIWLPVYQYLNVFFGNFVLLRFFSVFCVLATGYVLRKFKVDRNVAVATSLFYVLNPFVMFYGSQAMSESLASLLTVLFVYFFSEGKHDYASLVLACGVLTAYSFWVFVPFVLVYCLIKRKLQFFFYFLPVLAIVWWGYINYVMANEPLHFVNLASIFYEAITKKLSLENSPFNVALFPLVYPLTFVFPFFIQTIRIRVTKLGFSAKLLLAYYIVVVTVLLCVGQVLGYVFGWGRYFIPLIPAYLMLGCETVLNSKRRKMWIIAYFVLSLMMTVVQAIDAYNFKVGMQSR